MRPRPFLLALALAAGCAHEPRPGVVSPQAPPPSLAPAPAAPPAQASLPAPPAPTAPSAPPPAPTTAPAAPTAPVTPAAPAPLPLSDALPYPPGHRPGAAGSVAVSDADATVARWNRGGLAAVDPKHDPVHAAPRIRVDVGKIKGKLERRLLERDARSQGYWPIRLCYEPALRKAPKHDGKVELRLTLPPRGKAPRPKVVRSTLDDRDAVACIAEAVRGLDLPRAARGRATADLTVSLWPGDEPLYVREPDAASPPPLAPAAVRAALAAELPAVEACLRAATAEHPALWGRVALAVHALPDGTVERAAEIESRFPAPAAVACVATALRHARLPAAARASDWVWPLELAPPSAPPRTPATE